MAENSKIEWTDHTLNLWWGCTKVHTGCRNCYAETLSKRWGNDVWGEDKSRKGIESAFPDLKKYQRQAEAENKMVKIFCGSMMDIFEKPKILINPTRHSEGWTINRTAGLRQRLFEEISTGEYNNLIFLFLTKRPDQIASGNPPKNVWFGTSISDQETADIYVDQLRSNKKDNLFLSIEPQVGPINSLNLDGIKWVICGGESGHNARPMHPDWVRSIRDQCKEANVPFFFKQWGEYQEVEHHINTDVIVLKNGTYGTERCLSKNGDVIRFNDVSYTTESWRNQNPTLMKKVGKSKSGSELDGMHHKEFPNFE